MARHHDVQWYYIAGPVILVVFIIITIVAVKRRSRRRARKRQVSTVYVLPTPPPISTTSECCVAQSSNTFVPPTLVYKNQENPVYLVPYSALPSNFDYSTPGIQLRGDYVILNDLSVIGYGQTGDSAPSSYMEGYRKQAPYNPYY